MTELPVRPSLRRHVAHVVAYREQFDEETSERVLPDGATRLIFHVPDSLYGRSAIEVAGPSTEPAVLRLRGTVAGISVTLRPGAVRDVLGVPASEVAGQVVALDELWPETGETAARLTHTSDDAARGGIVQDLLEARSRPTSCRVGRAAHIVSREAGRRSVVAIAEDLGLSERRLQQLFRAHVGLTPRALGRIARMHAVFRALRGDVPPSWARIATDAGFYDQAHLANELRRLSGLTPSALLQRVSGFSKTSRPPRARVPE